MRATVGAIATSLLLLIALAGPAAAAPPDPVDPTPFTLEGICDFPVEAELSGKGKVMQLPGDRTLVTSPGLRVTLTNLDEPSNQVSYVITGSFLLRPLGDGTELGIARGRNIIFGPDMGMFLTIGRFTFIGFPDGTAVLQPGGNGRLTDVCAQLA